MEYPEVLVVKLEKAVLSFWQEIPLIKLTVGLGNT
jgi:hypothetical protein